MAYRRKGSGKPSSSEEPSRSDEPPGTGGADSEPGGNAGALDEGLGPATSRAPSRQCSVCGHEAELFELPGRSEKYCLTCSADVATFILLTTEIDAATMGGQDAEPLIAEFAQLSSRLLARAQLR